MFRDMRGFPTVQMDERLHPKSGPSRLDLSLAFGDLQVLIWKGLHTTRETS